MINEPNRAVEAVLNADLSPFDIRGVIDALLDLADGKTPRRPRDAAHFLDFLGALGRTPTTDEPAFYVWLGVLVRAEKIALAQERGDSHGT